jgi:hypothetical protein
MLWIGAEEGANAPNVRETLEIRGKIYRGRVRNNGVYGRDLFTKFFHQNLNFTSPADGDLKKDLTLRRR